MSLLAALVLFALVSLSPKLRVYLNLRSQFERNQRRLVRLELHAEQLQRVIDAIRNDADFASELTRIEFDAVQPDEEIIPVDSTLKMNARAVDLPLPPEDVISVWYEPFVNMLASDDRLRMCLLSAATILVVISFGVLQPPRIEPVSGDSRGRKSFWQNVTKRYARQT